MDHQETLSAPGGRIMNQSRIAGVWYLALAVLSGFAFFVTQSRFLVPGDAGATAALILADPGLFRLCIVANLAGQVCFLFAALAFYRLFEPVDKNLSRMLLMLVVASVPIAFLNALFQLAPLVLLGGASFLQAFQPAQLEALSMVFLKLHGQGIFIAGIFWGLWLLPLGLLVLKSRWFPRVLGVLLLINGLTYLVDSGLALGLPDLRPTFSVVLGVGLIIGEIPFLLWILVRGARVPKTSMVPTP